MGSVTLVEKGRLRAGSDMRQAHWTEWIWDRYMHIARCADGTLPKDGTSSEGN